MFYGNGIKGNPVLNGVQPGSKKHKKITGGGSSKLNILVVRITADGELADSCPCSMCINLMRIYGINRVYYSNEKGELCWQKISHIEGIEWEHVSRGLHLMMFHYGDQMGIARFPLTKEQKNKLYLSRRE
jgi:hypothetical protein